MMTQTSNIKFQSDIYVLLDTNDIQLPDRVVKKYQIISDTEYFPDIWSIPTENYRDHFSCHDSRENRCMMVTKNLCRILYKLVLPIVSNTYLEYYYTNTRIV